ncbi:MAG: hypothetical protein ABSE06_20230, partial [Anaerolineaceae bacterium]
PITSMRLNSFLLIVSRSILSPFQWGHFNLSQRGLYYLSLTDILGAWTKRAWPAIFGYRAHGFDVFPSSGGYELIRILEGEFA